MRRGRPVRISLRRCQGPQYHHRAQAPPSGESTLPREIAFDMPELQHAAELVHRVLPPTPQYAWPKLGRRAGCTVWVKHENHTPTGAFKIRGGLVYLERLRAENPQVP